MANRLTKRVFCFLTRRQVPYWLERDSILKLLWRGIRKVINVVIAPLTPVTTIRMWLYRIVGYQIGKRVFIGMRCYLDDWEPSRIVMEDDVVVAYSVTFVTHGLGCRAPVVLRKGAFVGAGSILLGHTTVGRSAFVAAGSVVTRDVPDKTVVAGNPAKPIAVVTGESPHDGIARIDMSPDNEDVQPAAPIPSAWH